MVIIIIIIPHNKCKSWYTEIQTTALVSADKKDLQNVTLAQ